MNSYLSFDIFEISLILGIMGLFEEFLKFLLGIENYFHIFF